MLKNGQFGEHRSEQRHATFNSLRNELHGTLFLPDDDDGGGAGGGGEGGGISFLPTVCFLVCNLTNRFERALDDDQHISTGFLSRPHPRPDSSLALEMDQHYPCRFCFVSGNPDECSPTCVFLPAVGVDPQMELNRRMEAVYGYNRIKKWFNSCIPEKRDELMDCLGKEANLRHLDKVRGGGGRILQLETTMGEKDARISQLKNMMKEKDDLILSLEDKVARVNDCK